MSFWRRISYSISGAILLVVLSRLFYQWGGEFIAVPGIILHLWFNLALEVVTNNYYRPDVGTWMQFSVAIYSLIIYVALLFKAQIQKNQK